MEQRAAVKAEKSENTETRTNKLIVKKRNIEYCQTYSLSSSNPVRMEVLGTGAVKNCVYLTVL